MEQLHAAATACEDAAAGERFTGDREVLVWARARLVEVLRRVPEPCGRADDRPHPGHRTDRLDGLGVGVGWRAPLRPLGLDRIGSAGSAARACWRPRARYEKEVEHFGDRPG